MQWQGGGTRCSSWNDEGMLKNLSNNEHGDKISVLSPNPVHESSIIIMLSERLEVDTTMHACVFHSLFGLFFCLAATHSDALSTFRAAPPAPSSPKGMP